MKKSSNKITPVRIETVLLLTSDLNSNTLLSELTGHLLVILSESLGPLYSHVLLIPTKSCKSRNQVVHKQKLKGPKCSTCQMR